MTVLKLLLVLALIVYGIKRKIFVGYLLFAAGVVIPLLFGHGIGEILGGIKDTLTDSTFWHLFAAIIIVTTLGQLLKSVGALDKLTGAAQDLAGGKRTAAAVLPAMVGLMPMPGGALLSAPLVGEVLKHDNKSPQFLSANNYWFRHIMEFFWPLYPGIILGATIVGVSIQTYSLMGVIMTVAMLCIGYLFFLRKIQNSQHKAHNLKSLYSILGSVWPLFITVFLALALNIDILIGLVIAIVITLIIHRPGWKIVWSVIKVSLTFRLFLMVFGILVFKDLLELSGAVRNIPDEVVRYGIPPVLIVFIVPFLSGLLTGMLVAFVGLSFPIIAGFLYLPEINLSYVFLAHISGYLGMILSPTHFCLLLTSEYFKAELGQVYKNIIIPVLILAAFGFVLYVLGYPWSLFQIL